MYPSFFRLRKLNQTRVKINYVDMWNYRSIKAVFRFHQLGMIVVTLVYFVFLSKINSTMIEHIHAKNLEQFQQVYVRGEIARIIGKPLCDISNCECVKIIDDYPLCLFIGGEKNIVSQGKCYGTATCESNIRGIDATELCQYICRPADEIVYSVRFSETPVQGDLWLTWSNETIKKTFVRQNGFRSNDLIQLQTNLLGTLKRPTRVWIPREGEQIIHWTMPVKDGMFIVLILTLISFGLIIMSSFVIVSWVRHIYDLTKRKTQKIFADPNDSVLHMV